MFRCPPMINGTDLRRSPLLLLLQLLLLFCCCCCCLYQTLYNPNEQPSDPLSLQVRAGEAAGGGAGGGGLGRLGQAQLPPQHGHAPHEGRHPQEGVPPARGEVGEAPHEAAQAACVQVMPPSGKN